ncbi:hypothetical protein Cgig2_026431 [Carnegiea gigantea]|uniref:Ubiquitin-like protease family profile domain-containing protein n=1 Tax=Carnegiea gigantea TaxID=171969 RepID=A0A9Q1KP17_9CARY|nr:hypothetical protein Cgig2_026431 [Carnegiea gigantea]
MACNKLLFLIERLDYEQWTPAMETGFGGFLSVRTSTIPKDLATWLLQKFDPVSNTLKLSDNRVLEITEEDVHATLALPMGQLEVQVASTCEPKNEYTKLLEQWRIRWNLSRTKVGKMVDRILDRGDHGDEFKRDFVLYIISTYIIGSMNGDCFFRILKSLVDVNEIVKYNWCAFLLQCLNDTDVPTKIYSCYELQLFYLDRVEFRGKRCKDRWFPTAIHWTIDTVEQRNNNEKEFPGEYGRGKTIDRINYQSIIREGETHLHEEFASLARDNQKHTDPAALTPYPPPAPRLPCSEYGREREPPLAGPNDPIEDEHFFNDPAFFDAYLKMEAVALKHYQHRTPMDYTSPTFDLGIPLSPERRTPTTISSPIKGTPIISSSPAYNDEQVCLGESEGQHTSINAIVDIALQYSKSTHHIMQQEKDNGQQQVEDELHQKPKGNVKQPLQNVPQRKRRVIKILPFIRRSPYLRDHRDIIKDKLTHIINAIYCIYLFINSEELYELNAHDKAHRLRIDKEAIASMASADSHLENSILDVWSIIMNKKQLTRFFFTTYAYIAILHAQKPSFKYQEFYRVMQLETQRTNWFDLNTADLVFFPILRSEHFFLVVFQFADKIVNIIDNLTLPEKPSTRYGDCATLLKRFFSKYLIQRSRPRAEEVKDFQTVYVKTDYQDNINLHDCGIYTMHHMETYYGDLQSWC